MLRLLGDDKPMQPRLITLNPLKCGTQPQPPDSSNSRPRPQAFITLHTHTTPTPIRRQVGRLGGVGVKRGHTPNDLENAKPAM